MKIKERVCANCHKIVQYSYGTKPSVCPYCNNQWWDKPKDEFILFTLQDAYIKSGRSTEKLSPMYDALIRYSENLIKKNLKGKKILDLERIHEQAEDTALNFLEVYLKKPNYVVESSFGGLLARYVAGVMYKKSTKHNDQLISLDNIIADDMKIEDNLLRFLNSSTNRNIFNNDVYSEYSGMYPAEIISEIFEIIEKKYKYIVEQTNMVNGILFLVAIRLFFLKSKKCSIDEYYDYYGDDLKYDIDDCLELIKRRLKNGR